MVADSMVHELLDKPPSETDEGRAMTTGKRGGGRPPQKRDNNDAMRMRLRSAMEEKEMNPHQLSKTAGLYSTFVTDFFSGKVREMDTTKARKLAEVLNISLDWLIGNELPSARLIQPAEPDRLIGATRSGAAIMPIMGVAETGVWRSGPYEPLRRKEIEGPHHPRHPDAKLTAVEMRDLSMDIALPMPLPMGTFALCAHFDDTMVPHHCGIAVIRQQDGDRYQLIVRRLNLQNGGGVLLAESSRPDLYPEISLEKLTTDPNEEIYLIGEVYSCVSFLVDPLR
jgi:hypothetical protein